MIGLQRVVLYAPKVVPIQHVQEPQNPDLDRIWTDLNRSGLRAIIICQTGMVEEPIKSGSIQLLTLLKICIMDFFVGTGEKDEFIDSIKINPHIIY